MIIDKAILDDLSAKAKASPRLRMAIDSRNSASDLSQKRCAEQQAYEDRPGRDNERTSAFAVIIGDACEAFIGGFSLSRINPYRPESIWCMCPSLSSAS